MLDGNNQVSQTYGYSNDGLTQSITDGNGHAITYAYAFHDLLTKTTYADGTYEQLTLDNGGRVNTKLDRAGISITYTYDNLDRESSETNPDSSTPYSYTYDLVGRPLTVTDLYGTFTYQYDTAGRQKQTTRPDGKVTAYIYDADDNTATIAYPDAYLYTYVYDELDRMTGVSETPPGGSIATLATYSYDALSRRTALAYSNTTSSAYAYDDFSGLTSITHNFAATSPFPTVTYSYTRDANERRQTDTVSLSGLLQHPPAAGTTTYQANTLNQYTTINGQTLTYGARGNLGTDPTAPLGSATYAFDNHSRMITATNSQHSASYTYDAMARRAQSTVDGSTKVFINDGSRTIADYTPSGVEIQHFVYGADNTPILTEYFGGQPTPQQHWQHTDALGSTVYLTDSTGKTTASFHYSPWGEGSTTGQTPYLFAGMRIDPETLLYYDHARYYSPAQGRFISPDPSGVKGGIDLYAYGGNDPLNATDPTGLDQECDGFCQTATAIYAGVWNLDGAFAAAHTFYDFHYGDSGTTVTYNGLDKNVGTTYGDYNYTPPSGATQLIPGGNSISATNPIFALDQSKTSAGSPYNTANAYGDLPSPITPVSPSGALKVLGDTADQASGDIPLSVPQPFRGFLVHLLFDYGVNQLGGDYFGEQTYLNGEPIDTWNIRGSSRVDAGYGNISYPDFVVDVKTGGAYVSNTQLRRYNTNLPGGIAGTPLYTIFAK